MLFPLLVGPVDSETHKSVPAPLIDVLVSGLVRVQPVQERPAVVPRCAGAAGRFVR